MNRIPFLFSVFIFTLVTGTPGNSLATTGHFLHGIGAINSSMGGASTANSVDTLGAIFNNPATLSGIDGSRLDFSFELFKPDRTLESTAPTPGGPVSGKTDSKSEIVPIPAFGVSHRAENSRLTHGLGILAIAGFGVDYPQDSMNPILAPTTAPADQRGFGHVFSNYQLMKISPALAYAPVSKLSIGAALNFDWASLGIEPNPGATPDCVPNPNPPPPTFACNYPSTSNQVGAYGFGLQLGVQYQITSSISAGAAYTSTQWFQEFEWNTVNANPDSPGFGQDRQVTFRLDVPQVISFGLAWEPSETLLIATDVRHINYSHTAGFKGEGFNPDGSVAGFGWEDIWVFGIGTQYRPMDRLALRLGYNYSENPVPDDLSFFNIPAPAIIMQRITAGAGWDFSGSMQLNLAYYHAFENSGEGPIHNPELGGPVPGSSIKNTMHEDSALIEISYRF